MRQPLWSSGRNAESGQAKEGHHVWRGASTARSSRQRWCHITAGLNFTVFSKLEWKSTKIFDVIATFWYGNILENVTFLYTALEYFYTAIFFSQGSDLHTKFFWKVAIFPVQTAQNTAIPLKYIITVIVCMIMFLGLWMNSSNIVFNLLEMNIHTR